MWSVLNPRSWIFWWAGLTSLVFLQTWLHQLAGFFRDQVVFSPNIPPFNFVPTVNSAIDAAAEYIRTTVQFRSSDVLVRLGPLTLANWIIALFVGILILIGAGVLYSRALSTSTLLDDFVALIVLYFVIRVEAHLIAIANIDGLSNLAQAFIANPWISFVILMLLLLGLIGTGGGLRSARSFWLGLLEAVVVAILIFPTQAGGYIANVLDLLARFGALLQTNVTFSLVWGLLGLILAVRRLYYVDANA